MPPGQGQEQLTRRIDRLFFEVGNLQQLVADHIATSAAPGKEKDVGKAAGAGKGSAKVAHVEGEQEGTTEQATSLPSSGSVGKEKADLGGEKASDDEDKEGTAKRPRTEGSSDFDMEGCDSQVVEDVVCDNTGKDKHTAFDVAQENAADDKEKDGFAQLKASGRGRRLDRQQGRPPMRTRRRRLQHRHRRTSPPTGG